MDLASDAISWPVARLRSTLSNLLFYLDVPNAEQTAHPDWLAKTSAEIEHDFQAVTGVLTDRAEWARISKLRVDATHFANLLNANPGISLSQWTEDFPDCMPRLRGFLRELQAIEEGLQKQRDIPIPEGCMKTITGKIVFQSDLTEESRTSGEWAVIFDWDGGRKTFGDKTESGEIRAVRDERSKNGSPKYYLHRNDITAHDEKTIPLLRSTKIARDEKLKSADKPGRGGSRKVKA
jgi:hypothetical protein